MQSLQCLMLGCATLLAGCDGFSELGALPRGQTGVVYHDADGNGTRDKRERGLARVIVSNGRDVTLTDVRGRWLLPKDGPRKSFVIAPRGWRLANSDLDNTLIGLQQWTPSRTPTVVVGDIPDGPPADAQLCSDLNGPTCTIPCEAPNAMNVGDLLVIYVGDSLTEDGLAFIKALLATAGSARSVFIVHEDEAVYAQAAALCQCFVSGAELTRKPFKATLMRDDSIHVRFSDEQD